MNSLPLISHHLFVAAIGNEDRGHERPVRRERPLVGADGCPRAIALEVPFGRKPMAQGVRSALGEGLTEVRV
jgi:hypothetical protein